jgi:hypothetical protein
MKMKALLFTLISIFALEKASAATLIWSTLNNSNMELKSMDVKISGATGSISGENRVFSGPGDDVAYTVKFHDGDSKKDSKMLTVNGVYLVKITGNKTKSTVDFVEIN